MFKNPNGTPGGAGSKKVTQVFAGVAGLTFAVGGVIVYLLNGQILANQSLASNKEAQVGSSEQVAKRYDMTKATYDQMHSRIAFLESSISEKAYVPTLLQQIQKLAKTTHLTVMAVHPGAIAPPAPPAAPAKTGDGGTAGADTKKKAAPPPYDMMPVEINVVGTYADTVTFLYDLTRFPKILSVEGATMSPGAATPGGKSNAPQVTTNLKLTAFVFHDDAPAGSAPAPAAVKTAAMVVPPTAAGTLAGAAGRAAQGAAAATRAANGRSQGAVSTL